MRVTVGAILLQLNAVGIILLVFGGGIIAAFALGAGQRNNDTHFLHPPNLNAGRL